VTIFRDLFPLLDARFPLFSILANHWVLHFITKYSRFPFPLIAIIVKVSQTFAQVTATLIQMLIVSTLFTS